MFLPSPTESTIVLTVSSAFWLYNSSTLQTQIKSFLASRQISLGTLFKIVTIFAVMVVSVRYFGLRETMSLAAVVFNPVMAIYVSMRAAFLEECDAKSGS